MKTRIGQILNLLLSENNLRPAELARSISLPQPTIHRILTGACEHPHLSSLKPIAKFFSISIEQLKGLEPIPRLDHNSKIPLLTWKEAIDWTNQSKPIDNQLLFTDAKVGKNGYALKLEDSSMDPVFPKHTILIADPDKIPKDRSYVIAKLSNLVQPIFRQLLIDAEDFYLKALSPDFEKYRMLKLTDNDQILSTVIQAKRDWD